MNFRIVEPAPRLAVLDLAGRWPTMRRKLLAQARATQSCAIYRGDELLAVAMFARHGWRRVEMALSIAPSAAPHMRGLIRIAQLTLSRIGQDRLVVIAVHPDNRAGRRMARATGFRRARTRNPLFWVFDGGFRHEAPGWKHGAAGSGKIAGAATGGQ